MDRPTLTPPPFTYYGGKMTLASAIAELLPAHRHYVEPFAGSLAVLLAKEPSHVETVNDLDGDLMTFWRVLRDRPDELTVAAMLTPHSRADYAAASTALDDLDDLERARRVWVRLTQGRSHSMRPSGWKFSVDGRNRMPLRLETFAARMPAVAERLRAVSLENRDALDLIDTYGADPEVCVYADPPYLGSTRAANYRHELLEDDLHARLADALNACKASVVLSGYDSPLYADLFAGWHRTDLKAPTTLAGKNDGPREVLWSNVPLGVQGALDLDGALA